jgi:hypothetical protein
MAIPISNVTRRVVYTASGTGPYAFTFEILANTDIAVYRDDTLLTLTTNYTVTIAANGTGSITLTAAPTGATQIAIVGNRTIQRTTDFVTGGDFFANTVNDEMDQQTIFAQQNAEGLSRALIAPQTDPTTIDMTLPRASVRANKTLAFDANGDPTTGEVIGDNRGNWASGVAYNKRDIVKDTSNSNIYYCNTSHTSSGSQPISSNADSAKWDLFVDAVTAGDAQTAAEAAQAAAEAAQSAAETAETNAETAETNAETAASAASTSASNASTSATAAASSASAASSSATAASGSASTASTQASNASTSASNASTSASGASTSATNAAASASTATTQASNASTSASNAASSASAASTSASNAATSETNAAASASTASTQATNASNSATAASGSATSAASSAAAAASALDSFDDRYLGTKTSDPTLDNDGNALVAGALYFSTTENVMKVYDGASWITATSAGATSLLRFRYVATSGQTTFSGADAASATLTYTVNNIAVHRNGVTLDTSEYTASNGTSIVLTVAAGTGDIVDIIAFKSFTVADALSAVSGGTVNGAVTVTGAGSIQGLTVGRGAGAVSTNTAVGASALAANEAGGNNNTAVGYESLNANTTGDFNTAVGSGALDANTTASNNTAVGYQAGYSQQTGIDTTAIGYRALYTATGLRNTAVGKEALYSLTTGTNNTAIGESAGYSLTTGSKNVIIGTYSGNQGGLDIRTASNYIVLSDGDGNPRGIFDGSGNLLVGTTSNANNFRLYVNGTNDRGMQLDAPSGSGVYTTMNFAQNGAIQTQLFWFSNTDEFVISNTSGGVKLGNGATSWAAFSDERLKDIIEPITNAAEKVSSLRAVIGKYKTDADGKRRAFLIAQDVQAVLPEAVYSAQQARSEDETEYLNLQYTDTIPLLVAAIKEQQAIIVTMREELDALKAKVGA